jgi:hypothetical protein
MRALETVIGLDVCFSFRLGLNEPIAIESLKGIWNVVDGFCVSYATGVLRRHSRACGGDPRHYPHAFFSCGAFPYLYSCAFDRVSLLIVPTAYVFDHESGYDRCVFWWT